MRSGLARSAIVGLAAVLASTALAEAQSKRKSSGANEGYVQTCSRYGHGCTSAPIRRGTYDYEFRMPGGTWVSCRQDCRQALREEVLDFWETQRERNGDRFQ